MGEEVRNMAVIGAAVLEILDAGLVKTSVILFFIGIAMVHSIVKLYKQCKKCRKLIIMKSRIEKGKYYGKKVPDIDEVKSSLKKSKKRLAKMKTKTGILVGGFVVAALLKNSYVRQVTVTGYHAAESALTVFKTELTENSDEDSHGEVRMTEEESEKMSDENEADNTDQPVSQTERQKYDENSKMKIGEKGLKEDIDYEQREKKVFFHLLDEEELTKQKCREEVKKELSGSISLKQRSMSDTLDEIEQQKILSLTIWNDELLERKDYVWENPPFWPGTPEWYAYLPATDDMWSIIYQQETRLEECPDMSREHQIANNYWVLAKEYSIQKWKDNKVIVLLWEQAVYHFLEKLKYEEINMDNAYMTLNNLSIIYQGIGESGTDLKIKNTAVMISECIEEFIDEELKYKDEKDDPVKMREH